jgi:hypothetical protein
MTRTFENCSFTHSGRQPIETAPRDGTKILVCGGILQDAIHGDKTPLDSWALVFWEKSLEGGDWLVAHSYYYYPVILNPTHWMPLPAPPEEPKP